MNLFNVPAYPIWKDLEFTTEGTSFSAFESVDFAVMYVSNGNTTILMSGRASKRPGDAYVTVRINDIIAPYLRPRLMPMTAERGYFYDYETIEPGMAKELQFQWIDPDGNVATESELFAAYPDWSYDEADALSPALLRSEPIDGMIDPREFFLLSTYNLNFLWIKNSATGGIAASISKGGGIADYFPATFYLRAGLIQNVQDVYVDVEGPAGKPAYTIVEQCHRYAIYYVNAFGGWDAFLIRGKVTKTDSMTFEDYTRRSPSTRLAGNIQERGKSRISSAIVERYAMATHFLSDDEAKRMHHLTESPEIYVHDLQEDVINPAVLTDSSFVVKSYKNQGNRLFTYTLNIEMAVEKIRR